ncbi:carbohydrate ABC transporter permease [Pseudonocardia alni]|uniref:carbohydrate ABC transporter permease n=1 Tax=Pseudonocardia alni TaxID=33907 RepID=UPI0033EF8C95
MTLVDSALPSPPAAHPADVPDRRRSVGRWARFAVALLITAIVLAPVAGVFWLSVRPGLYTQGEDPLTLGNFAYVFRESGLLQWLGNSLAVTLATVVVSVVVAAPAGYALSRGRGRFLSGYSLVLFVVQSLPVITAVIPLFILFAGFGLVDSLTGVAIVYVGASMSVAIWMMAAYMDSIPVSLEQAAWIDGCSPFGGFLRIVLRNSLPGILSTAIYTFLVSWNDYLIALVFIRSEGLFTLPLGLQTFSTQTVTDWGAVMAASVVMLLPPVAIFALLNRYFSVGGIGGALAGQ